MTNLNYGIPRIDNLLDKLRNEYQESGYDQALQKLDEYIREAVAHRASLSIADAEQFDDWFCKDLANFVNRSDPIWNNKKVFIVALYLGILTSGVLGRLWYEQGLMLASLAGALIGVCFLMPFAVEMAKGPTGRFCAKGFKTAGSFALWAFSWCSLSSTLCAGYKIFFGG